MRRENEKGGDGSGKKGYPASVATGAVALVFLIIGFQTAMFVHKAAVTAIVNRRDRPDTVYVVDSAVAARVLAGTSPGNAAVTPRGGDTSGSDAGKDHAGGAGGNGASAAADRTTEGHVAVKRPSVHSPSAESVYRAHAVKRVENFRFDPNTVSREDLCRLGFSEKQAASIVNYRLKGGRFRRKTDFAKSYVVADSVYRRLEPYIDIPRVDLNLADSAAFDALPGIGGYFASRMVEYRKKLGGSYSYAEQLMDIWNFDREKYDALADLITVDSAHVRPYPMWSLPEDSLRLHPYIGTYAAHGIVLFRENNPPSAWSVRALERAGVLRREDASRLGRCSIASP